VRVPAISFDPPIASPAGVTPLAAAMAAGRTSVSPEARRTPLQRRRERWRAAERERADELELAGSQQAGSEQLPTADAPAPREARPLSYPPLMAQRAVLDRSPSAAAPEEEAGNDDLVLPVLRPGPRAPDADSALEQHLRRFIGTLGAAD
jgi:hypothetical protein